jgi:serine carboxypeptidase-like clade 1
MTKPKIVVLLPILLLTALRNTNAAVLSDYVEHIPGYDGPLPTKHYSGFINTSHPTDEDVRILTHYWLVEAASSPATAPTLVWMQGGPGGSSLIGLFTENGPLTLNDYSTLTKAFNETSIPTVFDNPYSWNRLGNVLYVEHPAPTGFSYCTGYTDKNKNNNNKIGVESFQCPPWNDETQAEASFKFFVKFFSDDYYSELRSNPLIFSGESYAGVLVPTLAKLLLEARTVENQHDAPYSIQGFALGNDCPGNQVYTCTPYSGWIGTQVALDFRFRKGMINESLYNTINDACEGEWGTYNGPTSQVCRDLLEDPVRPVLSSAGDTYQMGGGYYLYDTCDGDLLDLNATLNQPRGSTGSKYNNNDDIDDMSVQYLSKIQRKAQEKRNRLQQENALENDNILINEPLWMTTLQAMQYYNDAGTYACGQERASLVWLNLKNVQESIHTHVNAGRRFSFSTALPGYNFTAKTLLPLYNSTLIHSLDIMQYSGDADPCVPYIGTERWIASLNMPVLNEWKPWTSGNEIAGYITRYKSNTNHFFDFRTIRNAGHMVRDCKTFHSSQIDGSCY